jgi:outer membrane protein OmpA-like peptidoglycan-associated protein
MRRWLRPASIIALAPLLAARSGESADRDGAVISNQAIEQALQPPESVTRGLIVVHTAPDGSARAPRTATEEATTPPPRGSIALNIPFEFNSSDLQPQAAAQLAQLQTALNAQSLLNDRFMIAGHTDASGNARYNQQLSERRAAAVKQYLVARGVAAARLKTAGYGAAQLLLPARPEDPLNRRVEIRNLGELP